MRNRSRTQNSGGLTRAVLVEEVAREALVAVPPVLAVGPRKSARHRRKKVVDRPRDDDVVIQRNNRVGDDHCVAKTCSQRMTSSLFVNRGREL